MKLLSIILLMLTLTCGAIAAPIIPATPSERRAFIENLLEHAAKQGRLGRYAEAIRDLTLAHALAPAPELLQRRAEAFMAWGGHCREEVSALEACGAPCAEASAAARSRCLASVTITAPLVGALIVDGEARGPAPATLTLLKGSHRAILEVDGRRHLKHFDVEEEGQVVTFAAPPGALDAKALFFKANDRVKAGDPAGAIELFLAAHAVDTRGVSDRSSLLLNAGAAFDTWPGHCAETLEYLERAVEDCAGACRFAAAGAEHLAAARARCVAKLSVRTMPEGASVYVDGRAVGESPVELELVEGDYAIGVALEGHARLVHHATLKGGVSERVGLELPIFEVVEPAPTSLPALEDEAPPGWLLWSAVGLTGVGLAAGTYGAFGLDSAGDDYLEAPAGSSAEADARGEFDVYRAWTIAGYSLALVAGAGAALLYAQDRGEPAAWVPLVGPGSMGVGFAF